MIRILDVDSSTGWGGQEIRTQRLINGLNKDTFECYFAASQESKLYLRRGSINATFLPLKIRSSLDIRALIKLIAMIKKYDIDIIASHSGHDGWIAAMAGKITNTPVIRTRHLQIPITSAISYNLSSKVVVDSIQVKNLLISQKVQEKKIKVIHPGIDIDSFKPDRSAILRKELKLPQDTFLIGCTAFMRKLKRHDILLMAIAQLISANPKFPLHLVLIGDGPYKDNIITKIEELNLQKYVTLLGSREDLPLLLPDLDLFVLPSEKEAFGISIIEASASGVAVIGSDAGGIMECIEDAKTGYIFPKNRASALATKIEDLIQHPDKRTQMGHEGRQMVIEKFSLNKMIQQTEALYKEIAQ